MSVGIILAAVVSVLGMRKFGGQCCNAKLRQRATRILMRLRGLPEDRARELLAHHGYDLREVLDSEPG